MSPLLPMSEVTSASRSSTSSFPMSVSCSESSLARQRNLVSPVLRFECAYKGAVYHSQELLEYSP